MTIVQIRFYFLFSTFYFLNMRIPQQAKRVFKGEIFDVYQWQQTMYDGSHETFEMLKRPDTVQIVPTVGDRVLVSFEEQPNRPEPFYTPFGGRIDAGEEPLTAAKRELLEEAGMISDDWELWFTSQPTGKIEWLIYFFIARNCKKIQAQTLDPGERITVKEVLFEEFLEIALRNDFRGRELTMEFMKMKLEPGRLEEFKKRIFQK